MIHEAGHFFFSWFGHTVMILGGTLGELLAPMLCATYFLWKRETAGLACCGFWLFENFLYIGACMVDGRAEDLLEVVTGQYEWGVLIGTWNLHVRDRTIDEV